MNLQCLLSSFTNKWLFQDHLLSRTLPTWRTALGKLRSNFVESLPPSVTTELPAISRYLQSTTILTQTALCPGKPEQ